MTRKPPTARARWMAEHFVVGSIGLGAFFASLMFVTGIAFRGEALTEMLRGIPIWFLFGPTMVAIGRYQLRRVDAKHGGAAT